MSSRSHYQSMTGLTFENVAVFRADEGAEHSRRLAVDRGVLALQKEDAAGGRPSYRIAIWPIRGEENVPAEILIPCNTIRDIDTAYVATKNRQIRKGKTTLSLNRSIDPLRGIEFFIFKMDVADHDRLHEALAALP